MPNEAAIPDWVNQTPPAPEYVLMMSIDGRWEQDVSVTREEYIAMKAHLAAMRGHVKPDEAAAASA